MDNLSIEQLSKVPYFDLEELNRGFITNLFFYDNSEWSLWLPVNGDLMKIQGWPQEGTYFSIDKHSNDDFYVGFLNFLAQRANVLGVKKAYSAILDDFFNLASSLEKLSFFHVHRNSIRDGVSRIVVTEIEYIFSVCRSVFDFLQEVISKLWVFVQMKDGSETKKLKSKFSEMVLWSGKERDRESYKDSFALPDQLVEFYLKYVDFFYH